MYYDFHKAQQRLATATGFKDKNSRLNVMAPDLMGLVSDHLSKMESPTVRKRIKEENKSKKGGKSKSEKGQIEKNVK